MATVVHFDDYDDDGEGDRSQIFHVVCVLT